MWRKNTNQRCKCFPSDDSVWVYRTFPPVCPIWGSIENLPAPLNDGLAFFHEGLKHKVMPVPGVFFDVNPGKRRKNISNFKNWVRFSFGPSEENVRLGLGRLEKMITAAKK